MPSSLDKTLYGLSLLSISAFHLPLSNIDPSFCELLVFQKFGLYVSMHLPMNFFKEIFFFNVDNF